MFSLKPQIFTIGKCEGELQPSTTYAYVTTYLRHWMSWS